MATSILPKFSPPTLPKVSQPATSVPSTVQKPVSTPVFKVDSFASNLTSGVEGGGKVYPLGPQGEPLASQLLDVEVGKEGQTRDPVGPDDSVPHGVEIVQLFLGRLGYLDMAHQVEGSFDEATQAAVEQFQRDNGLPVTGVVDNATVEAMMHPRPRPGYGMPTTNGRFDPGGEISLSQSIFQAAANMYGEQLGQATSAAITQPDGSVVQTFENGSLVRTAEGGLRILDREGNSLLPAPDTAVVRAEAGNHFINQLAYDGSNKNCGYASCNMALSYLGVPDWSLVGVTPEEAYASTSSLREAGDPGSEDSALSTTDGMHKALTTQEMQAAGVQVTVLRNGSNQADADAMALAFMNGENDNIAFVVGGNPALGWGDTEGMDAQYADGVYDGSHFVTVVGYDPETDCFMVLDPMATGPIEVPREDMVEYMADTGVTNNDVTQVTYDPPQTQQP